jgi:mycothiol system anti-sigma-R factor
MKDCEAALQRIYEYLDGELDPADMDDIRHHIEVCESCYPEVKVAADLREALHRAARGQPCCPDGLRDRVARMIDQERARSEAGPGR